eukprot:409464_1
MSDFPMPGSATHITDPHELQASPDDAKNGVPDAPHHAKPEMFTYGIKVSVTLSGTGDSPVKWVALDVIERLHHDDGSWISNSRKPGPLIFALPDDQLPAKSGDIITIDVARMSDLTMGHQYMFKAAAINDHGQGPWSLHSWVTNPFIKRADAPSELQIHVPDELKPSFVDPKINVTFECEENAFYQVGLNETGKMKEVEVDGWQ